MTIKTNNLGGFIAPNSYIDYVFLLNHYNKLVEDMNDWLKTHTPEKDSISVYADDEELTANQFLSTTTNFVETIKTEEEQKHRYDWKSIPVFFEKNWNEKDFPKFTEFGKQLRGLRQLIINFIAPNGKITIHTDVDNWGKMSEDWGFTCEGYSLIATLKTGMKNSNDKTVGTMVRDIDSLVDTWSYPVLNEFVCFDGLRYNHAITNKTNEWRISAVFDIDKSMFDKKYIETDKQVCDSYLTYEI
jgi:hypothetical protein